MRNFEPGQERIIKKLLSVLLFVVIFFVLSALVMFLWNALLPQITHLAAITYKQALGLMLLCRILFGGFSFGKWFGGRHSGGGSRFLKDKLTGMDEDARAAFKEEWRRRCERKGE